jgi:hypothetical protein
MGEWEMTAAAKETHSPETLTAQAFEGSAVNNVFGDQPNLSHAISNDGSLVFWTHRNGEEATLFVRDTKTHETLQLDAVTSGTGAGHPDATFQTASADGSRVFFTDTQPLTEDSRALQAEQRRADLYVFELKHTAPLEGTLTDLTPQGVHGESAAVQEQAGGGGVLGASEDGSYVYFVANGALANGDPAGNCLLASEQQEPGRMCNLYARHLNGGEWEAPKLVAVLSNEDAPSWGGSGFPGDRKSVTSRVSPSGRYLAFMSDRSLTGYNNEDATCSKPATPAIEEACNKGERKDEEVFLFDATAKSLVCASCNPSGAQPAGVFDPGAGLEAPKLGAEGVGLVVDRPDVWGPLHGKVSHWLGGNVPGWTPISLERAIYQSRYLSDSGRLFFNSPDHLVPAATGVKAKVFEYEPNGVGGCASGGGCIGLLSAPSSAGEPNPEHESAFLDASENGNDVFFLTAAKLRAVNGTSGDVDSNFDVYDAHVCAQGPCLPGPPPGQVPCASSESCHGAAPPPLSFVAPASKSVSVARGGTLPSKVTVPPKRLTRAQLLARALKVCRTKFKAKKKKKQRAACEARARKKYGHAATHKKSKKASRGSRNGRRR